MIADAEELHRLIAREIERRVEEERESCRRLFTDECFVVSG